MHSLSRTAVFGLVTAAMMLFALPALGAETSNSEFLIVPADDVVQDDLYAGVIGASIEGRIDGDLVIFASEEVVIDGEVTGSVYVVAPTVTVRGSIGRSLRVSAGSLEVSGDIGRDIVAVAYSAGLSSDSTVGQDVQIWAWKITALGEIGRDLGGTFRRLDLAGSVGRDVNVSVARLEVVGDLRVVSDMDYRSTNEAEGLQKADVQGVIVRKTPLAPNIRVRALGLLGRLLTILFLTIAALTTAWGWPDQTKRAIGALGKSTWKPWLVGLAVFVTPVVLGGVAAALLSLAPPSASLPLMAVFGPVILAMVGLLFALSLVAGVPVAGWLGRSLFRKWDVYGGLLAASGLIGVVWVIPLIGWLVPVLVLPAGLGGWISSFRAQQPAEVGSV